MKKAFTMAEVLITLGILGVVIALTFPILMEGYKKQVIETRLARFYSVINQAITMSEVKNGDKKYWDINSNGWETDEDGKNDMSKPPKSLTWFNRYLKDFVKTARVDYENTIEGKVMLYFPDGSLVLISESSWIFYPEAKDYEVIEDLANGNDRNREASGTKYFTFYFRPWDKNNKWLYGKGVEPYMTTGWDGTREMLLSDDVTGCKKTVTNERAYCTKLIQMNGWKFPKDYPLKL